MNDSETNPHTHTELADQIACLRRQVFVLLLALVVVSGTLAVYLCYQSRIIGKDIAIVGPQARPVIKMFNANRPGMEVFINQLIAYGSTHPDFAQQVLKKYGIIPAPQAAPAAPKK